MPDRRQQGKGDYPRAGILPLCLLAVAAGADAFAGIARSGAKKIELLRRFRPFENGTPSHDRLGGIFAALGAKAFQRCFAAFAARRRPVPGHPSASLGTRQGERQIQ